MATPTPPFTIKANFPYTARSETEANLIAGQTYTVLTTDGGQNVWWQIRDHTGKAGWVPASYVVLVETAPPPQVPTQTNPVSQPAQQSQPVVQQPIQTQPQFQTQTQQPQSSQPTQQQQQTMQTQQSARSQSIHTQTSPVQTQASQRTPAQSKPPTPAGQIVSDSSRQKVQLVVVGDGAVGKTCALVSYCTGTYPTEYIPTVFENYCVQLTVDGKEVELILMDTAGQEDYDKIRPLSYPNTDVFLLLYSIVSQASYDNVKAKWIKEVTHYCPGVPVILVGTKMDLRDSSGKSISFDEGLQLSQELTREVGQRVYFMECSAYTRQGLAEVFTKAVSAATQARQGKEQSAANAGHSRCILF